MLFQHSKCRAVCTNPKCIARGKELGNLVRNGKQRNGEQRYKCKICGNTCNAWSGTPLCGIHLKQKFLQVAKALARHCTIADASDLFEVRKDTVIAWLLRIGAYCDRFLRSRLRSVTARFVQFDEIQTWVGRKSQTTWVWQAIDACSKLWLAAHVSTDRGQHTCNWFVSKAAKAVRENSTVLVTSDGLFTYEHAIRSKFRNSAYAQVVKQYEGKQLVSVDKRVLTGESVEDIERLVQSISGGKTVNTAFTERLNATIRRTVGRLARRTLAFSRSVKCLEASVFVAQVAYNFVRKHRSLGKTPAQAAGICDSRLDWFDIIYSRS